MSASVCVPIVRADGIAVLEIEVLGVASASVRAVYTLAISDSSLFKQSALKLHSHSPEEEEQAIPQFTPFSFRAIARLLPTSASFMPTNICPLVGCPGSSSSCVKEWYAWHACLLAKTLGPHLETILLSKFRSILPISFSLFFSSKFSCGVMLERIQSASCTALCRLVFAP